MATINHVVTNPYTLKTASLTLKVAGAADTDDFSKHVGEITLTPASSSGTWTGASGNVIRDSSTTEWTVTLGLVQDLDAAGLLRFLLTNESKKADMTAILKTGGGTITGTVTLIPAPIGGAPGATPLASSVTLPLDNKPVWV